MRSKRSETHPGPDREDGATLSAIENPMGAAQFKTPTTTISAAVVLFRDIDDLITSLLEQIAAPDVFQVKADSTTMRIDGITYEFSGTFLAFNSATP
jgi:hypothetical protein